MTVEIALLISIISVAFSVYQGIANLKRNQATDAKRESGELTTVIVKLENIGKDTSEIKADIKGVKSDVKKNTEQIIRLDESLKSAWKRINQLEGHDHSSEE